MDKTEICYGVFRRPNGVFRRPNGVFGRPAILDPLIKHNSILVWGWLYLLKWLSDVDRHTGAWNQNPAASYHEPGI